MIANAIGRPSALGKLAAKILAGHELASLDLGERLFQSRLVIGSEIIVAGVVGDDHFHDGSVGQVEIVGDDHAVPNGR
jgi:hypothetical protein